MTKWDDIDWWRDLPWSPSQKQCIFLDAISNDITLQESAQRFGMQIWRDMKRATRVRETVRETHTHSVSRSQLKPDR